MPEQQQNQEEEEGGGFMQTIVTTLLIFFAVQMFMNRSAPPSKQVEVKTEFPLKEIPKVEKVENKNIVLSNAWIKGQQMNVNVYFDTAENFTDFDNKDKLIWYEPSLTYDWNEENKRTENITFHLTEEMQNNATIWAHVYINQEDYPIDPLDPKYDPIAVVYGKRKLTTYIKNPNLSGHNLLNKTDDPKDENITKRIPGEYYSYWKPELTFHLVHDFNSYPASMLQMPQFKNSYKVTPDGLSYYPVLFFNDFSLLKDRFIPLNTTIDDVPILFYYNTFSYSRFQMQSQMEWMWKLQESYGLAVEDEFDEIKRIFLETNPWFLGITMFISLLHTVFDFLAFKNDISFWNNAKSYEGLSTKTLFLNSFFQLVILLYLLDNETSWMVIGSSAIGVVIEIWKIRKVLRMKLAYWNNLPYIKFRDRMSYGSNKTRKYDNMAMKYLMYILFPLVIGSSIYSLYYNQYKSWYSWVLSSLTSFVYTFGFITMTPQLFINYKFKSVAHMPWRAMIYKSLNTFIDDLFAFIIKMPTLHRLACFRDDIVFFIYLYQRYIYPVDKKRRNEFGLTGEEEERLVLLRKQGKKNITLDDLQNLSKDNEPANKKEESKQEPTDSKVIEQTGLRNRTEKTEPKNENIVENLTEPDTETTLTVHSHRSKYDVIPMNQWIATDDD